MVRRKRLLRVLLVVLVVTSTFVGTAEAAFAFGGCHPNLDRAGNCGSLSGRGANVGGWERLNGDGGGAQKSRSTTGNGAGRESGVRSDARGTPSWCNAGVCGWAPEAPSGEEPASPGITLEDVASFVPKAPKGSMEPGPGVAVRRLPANFISHATEQVVAAPLLGRTAEVRFTPVGYVWVTGDGGRIESSTPGATWTQLRAKEFADTSTSHRYRERGTYEVQPTVTYEASYRVDGSDWIELGTLDASGEALQVRVVTVDTRLTRGTCREYPNDPGCR